MIERDIDDCLETFSLFLNENRDLLPEGFDLLARERQGQIFQKLYESEQYAKWRKKVLPRFSRRSTVRNGC